MTDTVINTESARSIRLRKWRTTKDKMFGSAMAVGGISVIVAILLIFFYLFWVVIPLFSSPKLTPGEPFSVVSEQRAGKLLHFAL